MNKAIGLGFSYDDAGRLTNETSSFYTGSPLSVKYEYDATGRRSKLIYPDTTFVTYDYNTNGWLTSILDGGTNAIVTYEYDSAGRRIKRTLQNSTFTVLDYDAAGQVTNIHHKIISGGSTNTLSQYRYGYDAAGQRTWVKRANGKGDVYKYDAIDQLTNVLYEATNPDTTPSAWTNEARYVFDAAGNRSSVTYTNSGTQNYSVNGLNQYTDVGGSALTHDANGNMSGNDAGPFIEFYYDAENRLREAYGEAWYEYAWYYHDGLGRLAAAESPTWGITRFVYDSEWRVIAEYDENGEETTLVAKYVYGPEIDEPLRMQRDGTNYYYHAAALGTVTEITGSTGTLLEQYRYDVYGEPTFLSSTGTQLSTSAIGNRFLFQGRDRDPDTGLYNFRFRNYSPLLGRFVQTDPIGDLGGVNLYQFAGNDPGNWIDPTGLVKLHEWLFPGCVSNYSPDPVVCFSWADDPKNDKMSTLAPFKDNIGNPIRKCGQQDWDFVRLKNGTWVKIGMGLVTIKHDGTTSAPAVDAKTQKILDDRLQECSKRQQEKCEPKPEQPLE